MMLLFWIYVNHIIRSFKLLIFIVKTQWISCDMILDLPALSCHTGVFVSENEKKYSSIFFPRIDVSKNNNYVFYYVLEFKL